MRPRIPRALAGGLLAVASVVAAVLLIGGGGSYEVDATFQNASQLVKGDLVTVAGEEVGKVKSLDVSDDGQAIVRLSIDGDYAPLRKGTRAVVRQRSLSGVANRYVSLQLGGADKPEIPDGGRIDAVETTSSVDLDQLFNTFDPKTRQATQKTIRLFRDATRGRERQAGESLQYLDPALAASSRLFTELDGDRHELGRFVDEVGGLLTDTATKDAALADLVRNLRASLGALADRRDELGTALDRLPPFLRRSNTTFANLRATLDDLDPLVSAARPVVRDDLRPLLDALEPFARGARPTVRDLARTINRPGADNDLVELLRRQPAVAQIAAEAAQRNGKDRPGALPVSASALKGATPQVSFFRPYTPDLVGWFDDFSHSGNYDALGSFSRAGVGLNQFSLSSTLQVLNPPADAGKSLQGNMAVGRNNRCPGSVERKAVDGSNPYKPSDDFNCDLSQVPIGK